MKIFYTLLIALTCSIGVHAQTQSFSLTFEDTAVINQVFYTDNILDSLGIWQIGVPNKPLFDSAYSPPNAIVTVLDSAMPPGTKASFIISLPNVQLGEFKGGLFSFKHKYQFDTAHGGGYVEFSVDTGKHWHPIYTGSDTETCLHKSWIAYGFRAIDTIDGQIIPIPTWWDNVRKDTTPSGIPYFTGTDSIWIFDTIAFPTVGLTAKTSQFTQYMFRFTAFTDSLSPELGGWLIDNIPIPWCVSSSTTCIRQTFNKPIPWCVSSRTTSEHW